MTRKTHNKTAARDLAAREGITYQQALTRLLNEDTPVVGHIPAFRLTPDTLITRMTNGCCENVLEWNNVTEAEFTGYGLNISYWNSTTGALSDTDTTGDWYPLTVAEATYVTDATMAGDLMLTYSGFTTDAEGQSVKVLLPSVELAYDDEEWQEQGYTDLPSSEKVLAYAQEIVAALNTVVGPLGGYATVAVDDYISGPCHTVEAVVPLPAVMVAYPAADDWFTALEAAVEPIPYPSLPSEPVDEATVQARREAELQAAFDAMQQESAARQIIDGLNGEVRNALENAMRDEWFHIKRIRREESEEFGDAEATFTSLADSWAQMGVDIQFAVASTGRNPVSDATLAEVSVVIARLAADAATTPLDSFVP